MDHPRPSLRYVNASDLRGQPFADFTVEGSDGDKLGEVDGFIVDINTRRPQYLVVDAGGWFKSKRVLIPVGHVSMNATSRGLQADLTKDRVKRFPGFDRDEFETLSADQLGRLDMDITAVCCEAEQRRHDLTPDWWNVEYYEIETTRGVSGAETERPAMAHERRTTRN